MAYLMGKQLQIIQDVRLTMISIESLDVQIVEVPKRYNAI